MHPHPQFRVQYCTTQQTKSLNPYQPVHPMATPTKRIDRRGLSSLTPRAQALERPPTCAAESGGRTSPAGAPVLEPPRLPPGPPPGSRRSMCTSAGCSAALSRNVCRTTRRLASGGSRIQLGPRGWGVRKICGEPHHTDPWVSGTGQPRGSVLTQVTHIASLVRTAFPVWANRCWRARYFSSLCSEHVIFGEAHLPRRSRRAASQVRSCPGEWGPCCPGLGGCRSSTQS